MLNMIGHTTYDYTPSPKAAYTCYNFLFLNNDCVSFTYDSELTPLLDLLPRCAQPPRRQDTSLSSSSLIIAFSDLLALASQPSAKLSSFLDVEASPPEGSDPPQTGVDSPPPNIGP